MKRGSIITRIYPRRVDTARRTSRHRTSHSATVIIRVRRRRRANLHFVRTYNQCTCISDTPRGLAHSQYAKEVTTVCHPMIPARTSWRICARLRSNRNGVLQLQACRCRRFLITAGGGAAPRANQADTAAPIVEGAIAGEMLPEYNQSCYCISPA